MTYIKSILASTLLLGLSAQAVNAQDYSELNYKPYPYGFVTFQGGGQLTFTDYKNSKLITPIGAVSVGGMFAPAVGARLNVNGWKTRSGLKSAKATYDFNYVNSNLDLMLNLTNIFMPKERVYPVNFYLIGGVGLTYAWENDDLKEIMKYDNEDKNLYHAWDDDRLVHNFRAGLQIEANIAKRFGINVEVTANNMHDRFNSKVNHHGDWQLQAMAGLTFKFGHKKKEIASMTSSTAQNNYNNNQNADLANAKQPIAAGKQEEKVVTPAPKPAPAPKAEVKKINIFFNINSIAVNSSEENKLKELAEWMKAHPNTKASLEGYADADTGTSAYNKKISAKRVQKVCKMLNEKYGISNDRIITTAKGDTVQPFNENDKNRVVIGIAK